MTVCGLSRASWTDDQLAEDRRSHLRVSDGETDQLCQIAANTRSQSSSQSKTSSKANGPKALIVEPNRELAQQTYDCLKSFAKELSGQIRQVLLVGGVQAREQMDALSSGVDIVVGTPGRIDELINNGYLTLESCRSVTSLVDANDSLNQWSTKR